MLNINARPSHGFLCPRELSAGVLIYEIPLHLLPNGRQSPSGRRSSPLRKAINAAATYLLHAVSAFIFSRDFLATFQAL